MTRAEPGPAAQAAQRYAEHGWRVFPLQPGSKLPYPRTHGYEDATADPDKAAWMFGRRPADSNVGIATGAPGPDVVDVDQHGERGSGFAAWNEASRAGLVDGPQAIVRTPSGGMHAYFHGTGQRSAKIPSRHLDFRAQGGYIVAPPSQVNGRSYVVVSKKPSTATVDWQAIRDLVDPQPLRRGTQLDFPEGGQRDVSHLVSWMAAQPQGNRNDALFWASCRAAEADDEATLNGLAEAARAAGLDARGISATIRSAQRTARPFQREAG